MKDPLPIYYDLPEREYHADMLCPEPSISKTLAHILLERSPQHARHASLRMNAEAESEHTEAMAFGSLVHRLMLGKGTDYVAVDVPDWRSKAAREMRDDARAAGRIAVKQSDLERATEIVASAWNQLQAMDLPILKGMSDAEVSLFWQQDGVWNRARPDLIPRDFHAIYDVKTVVNAAPQEFGKIAWNHGYHLQAAHYQSGVQQCFELNGRPRFRFILLEKQPPYAVSVVELDGAAHDIGHAQMMHAREVWRDCLDQDQWRGYTWRGIAVAETPPWRVREWEAALDVVMPAENNPKLAWMP